MPASLRIIKIVKDKDPITNEEREDYTVEIECEAEDSGKLAMELAKCPYGEEIVALLKRAEFLPLETTVTNIKEEAEKEMIEVKRHDEELRQGGRDEMFKAIIEELHNSKGTKKATDLVVKFKETVDKIKIEGENDE
jgi:hypothetical protein